MAGEPLVHGQLVGFTPGCHLPSLGLCIVLLLSLPYFFVHYLFVVVIWLLLYRQFVTNRHLTATVAPSPSGRHLRLFPLHRVVCDVTISLMNIFTVACNVMGSPIDFEHSVGDLTTVARATIRTKIARAISICMAN